MTIKDALHSTASYLKQQRLESPREDAEFLVAWVLGRDRAFLLTHPERQLSPAEEQKLHEAMEARGRHYPLQYLAGVQEFFGRPFRVDSSVLIPRPETELVVQTCLEILSDRPEGRLKVLDIGTGSGCIAVTIACECDRVDLTAVDISESALAVAMDNSMRLGCPDRIEFLAGNLLEPVADRTGCYHLIVSNPPYVPDSSPLVAVSVKDFEPSEAVFAGPTGLEIYRRIFAGAGPLLRPDGCLVLELGYETHEPVRTLAAAAGWQLVELRKDLAGIPRCAAFCQRKDQNDQRD